MRKTQLPFLVVLALLGLPVAALAQPACTDTTPQLDAVGSRYLQVTFDVECTGDVAIQVLEDGIGGGLDLFVQPFGQLGTTPHFRSQAEWNGTGNCGRLGASGHSGTCGSEIMVRGAQIVPNTLYRVKLIDGATGAESATSQQARTWRYGKMESGGSLFPGGDDLLCVLDLMNGSSSLFLSTCTVYSADLTGACECAMPDGIVDQKDVDAVLDAIGGGTFPCPRCAFEDFESGDGGWMNGEGPEKTCTTGDFVRGTPLEMQSGGIVTQLEGDHTTGTGNAVYTASNTSAGIHDVDGGTCILESPDLTLATAADLSIWFFHGQRDTGDDNPGDFAHLEYSTDGGLTWDFMETAPDTPARFLDVAQNAEWTRAFASVPRGSDVKIRYIVSDGAGPGDIIEAGIDDFVVCPAN